MNKEKTKFEFVSNEWVDQAKIISSPNKKVANAIRILPLHDPDQYKAAFILQGSF